LAPLPTKDKIWTIMSLTSSIISWAHAYPICRHGCPNIVFQFCEVGWLVTSFECLYAKVTFLGVGGSNWFHRKYFL
jgi:hypothetical protein